MIPLLKGAEQIRYHSPIYESIYDEDDNIVDEELVREGTDVLNTFLIPVATDKKSRYYRLRYSINAKEHKHKWQGWINAQMRSMSDSDIDLKVKVSKIGRRVMFEYDHKYDEKKVKVQRRIIAKNRRHMIAEGLDATNVNELLNQLVEDIR